jgi:hypothetical protein
VVKQIESLGKETISGRVCSLTLPFDVQTVAPAITFLFHFVPGAADHGQWTYAYSLRAAGETHAAHGSFTVRQVNAGGTLQLTMSGSDHVVFHGFDGNIPTHYAFQLVPAPNTACP